MAREKRKFPFKYVEVVWFDIATKDSWCSTEKPTNPVEVHERGWLIFEGKLKGVEVIVISNQLTEREGEDIEQNAPDDIYDMGTHSTIPRGCVQSIRGVRV